MQSTLRVSRVEGMNDETYPTHHPTLFSMGQLLSIKPLRIKLQVVGWLVCTASVAFLWSASSTRPFLSPGRLIFAASAVLVFYGFDLEPCPGPLRGQSAVSTPNTIFSSTRSKFFLLVATARPMEVVCGVHLAIEAPLILKLWTGGRLWLAGRVQG